VPFVVGMAGAWIAPPGNMRAAAWRGAWLGIASSASLLVLGLEGIYCVVMALPVVVPLSTLGAVAGFFALRTGRQGGRAALLLIPVGIAGPVFDVTAKPEVFPVTARIEIDASAEKVWRHVVSFADLPAPEEWYFRNGIAYPIRARIEGSGADAIRYCEFSTGVFVEPIQIWDEPRLLRFSVSHTPAPMREFNPLHEVHAAHLNGYLVSKQGEFRLTAITPGRTLLEGTTWYQHGLWPLNYWKLWSDAIIHRIHGRVLRHIKQLAES
jgi:hypothetical protein